MAAERALEGEVKLSDTSENHPVIIYPPHTSLAPLNTKGGLTDDELKWEQCIRNPADFDGWVALVKLVEQKDDLLKIRRTLRGLLTEFPLCFGYWKRLAGHEKRYGDVEKAFLVLEEGLKAAPYAHQLWLHYGVELKAQGKIERARSVFRRGCAIVGTDFGAETFWKAYLDFEKEGGTSNFPCILEVYIRVLAAPLATLETYYETFQQLAMERPNSDLQTAAVASKQPTYEWESSPSMLPEGKTFEEVAAERGPPLDDMSADRATLMMQFHALFQKTKDIRQKISPFVPQLQRPYFHVKLMEEAEVESWRLFLTFLTTPETGAVTQSPSRKPGSKAHMKSAGWNMPLPYTETVKVFERAVVPCALYADIWRLYAGFMEDYDTDAAHEVHARALKFVKSNEALFLSAALFEERVGNIDAALRALGEAIGRGVEGTEVALNLVNLQRRHGSPHTVARVYEAEIAHFRQKIPASLDTFCILTMHFSRYWQDFAPQENSSSSSSTSLSIYETCHQLYQNSLSYILDHRPSSPSPAIGVLLLDYIHFEHTSRSPNRVERVTELYERALSNAFKNLLPEGTIRTLWENYVSFVEDRAHSIEDILAVKQRASIAASRKRKSEASNASGRAQKSSAVTAATSMAATTAAAAAAVPAVQMGMPSAMGFPAIPAAYAQYDPATLYQMQMMGYFGAYS